MTAGEEGPGGAGVRVWPEGGAGAGFGLRAGWGRVPPEGGAGRKASREWGPQQRLQEGAPLGGGASGTST